MTGMIQITPQMRNPGSGEPVDGRKGIRLAGAVVPGEIANRPFSGCLFRLPQPTRNSDSHFSVRTARDSGSRRSGLSKGRFRLVAEGRNPREVAAELAAHQLQKSC